MNLCSRCGGELGNDGLCEVCLMAGGFDSGTESNTIIAVESLTPVDPQHALENDGFGPYRILRVLGQGGMGTVYLAEQSHPIRRQVALKVVKPGMDRQNVLSRFNHERQALALMDHPSIARVYDADATEGGRPYFVMEYIDGLPITEYCDHHRLNTEERLELILLVCQGLQHAHQKGVIHRDIKPSNILVKEQDGHPVPKIIDFGIAKATGQGIDDNSALTQFGQLVGTLEYISPEQADTIAGEADTGSDVYSLGVVIYELLVGAVPFDAGSLRRAGLAELLRIIREEQAPPLSDKLSQMGNTATDRAACRRATVDSLRRELIDDLNWIVLKAVDKDRERRYQSVSELAADIRRHMNSEPVVAGASSTFYRARKFVRRHKLEVAAVVIVAASLLAGMISTAWEAHVAVLQRARADAEAAAAQASRSAAERSAQEAQQSAAKAQASVADLQKVQAHLQKSLEVQKGLARDARVRAWMAAAARWQTADPALALYLGWHVAQIGRPLPPGLEDLLTVSLENAPSYGVLRDSGVVGDVAWNPDGKTIASLSDQSIRIWDAATGIILRTLPNNEKRLSTNHLIGITWSSDGRILASASLTGTIRLWDVASGRVVRTLQNLSGIDGLLNSPVAWSPDGRMFAAAPLASSNRRSVPGPPFLIRIWAAGSGELLQTIQDHEGQVYHLAWSPDGRLLAAANSYGVVLWDATNGKQVRSLEGSKVGAVAIAWSSDGKMIAAAGHDHAVRIWDAASGQTLHTMRGHQDVVTTLAFSPAGGVLASGSLDRSIRLWETFRGEPLRTLQGHRNGVWRLAWSPDGRALASASDDGTVRLWDMTLPQFTWDIPNDPSLWALPEVVWSPNGKTLAYVSNNRTVRLLDPISRAPLTSLHGYQVVNLAFSPDGATLASIAGNDGIQLWDAASGRMLRILKGGLGGGYFDFGPSLAWNPDGTTLASGSSRKDQMIQLWNATNGELRRTIQQSGVLSLSWSPDGRTLAAASYDSLRLWDGASGGQLRILQGYQSPMITFVAWSPDGRTLAAAVGYETVPLWDAASGRQIRVLQAHGVEQVAWSPDGNTLAVVTSTGGTILWDAISGQTLRTLQNSGRRIAWSPDGRSLATMSSQGIRLLPGTLDSLLDEIGNNIRLFTPSTGECRQYFGSETCLAARSKL